MSVTGIILNALFEALVLFLILGLVLGVIFFAYKMYRKKNNMHKKNTDEGIKNTEEDVFGLEQIKDEKKFKKDLEEIKKSVESGEQVKVDFAKAMYILKNFSNYNFFSSEDNRIVFEKLKQTIDEETKIESQKFEANTTEKIKTIPKKDGVTTEKLEDGSIKVYNPSGYTIIKDRIIIESVNYEEEKRKKEDESSHKKGSSNVLEKKIDDINSKVESIEHQRLNEKVKDVKIPVDEKNKKIDKISNNINNDMSILLNEFEDFDFSHKVATEEKTAEEVTLKIEKSKKFNNIASEYELLEDYNMVFILMSFEEQYMSRSKELVKWILNHENLIDEDNGYIFVDIELDKRLLYVDVNLFVYLFAKFYKEPKKIYDILLYSGEVINLDNLNKVIHKFNELLENEYGVKFFSLIGKTESPLAERLITYKIKDKKIVSSQMLMIDLDIKEEKIKLSIDEIKNNILSKYEPKIFKASIKDNKNKIENIGISYFFK